MSRFEITNARAAPRFMSTTVSNDNEDQIDLFQQDQSEPSPPSSDTPQSRPGGNTRLAVGVDYGTSNSAVALYDGERVHFVALEGNQTVMPSATYIDNEFKITTGQSAIDAYIASNTGRTVELSAELLGEGRSTTGQIGDGGLPEEGSTEKVYGQSLIDAGQKGRLFRGVKRLLGSAQMERLMVFDRPFRLVALVTPLLLRIHQRAELWRQQAFPALSPINQACIGHPVNFEGKTAGKNQQALGKLSEAYRYAGFTEQSFYPEPTAAALSYLRAKGETTDQIILAVDFGGGTLDLCLMKNRSAKFEVLTTWGIGLGGDHIDQRLFLELICPLLGKGERWRRAGADREIETLFPFKEYEALLLNWPISYMLNQNKYTTPIMQRMEQGDEAAEKFARLYELIKRNYSYLVFQTLKDVKATLSSHETATIDIPELDIEIQVTRAEFENIIAELLEQFSAAIDKTLARAGLSNADIGVVLRTGGSSLIPAVRNILEERFGNRVVEHDPFTSVAAGLAIAAYEDLGLGNHALYGETA